MPPVRSLPDLPKDFESKLFHGDVVAKNSEPSYRGKVVRGWVDEDPPDDPMFPDMPQLARGEVMLSNMTTGEVEVVSELSLTLFERAFVRGDFVKHSLMESESALVVDVETDCQLEHVISHQRLRGWVPWTKLRNAVRIEAKDRVVYDNWIGTVEEVFENGLIEAQGGGCYRIAEMGGLLETGRSASEVLPEQAEFMQHFSSFPPTSNTASDRVVQVLPLIVYVVWNAINQTIPPAEHDKWPEPKKFWCGAEIEKLTHFEAMRNQAPPLHTTVEFRDVRDAHAFGVVPTLHVEGTLSLSVYKVVENRTKLKLRWQDGTETEEYSAGLVPYRNVDDYEAWPGEALVWRSDTGQRRPAIVQTYDAKQRIAEIYLLDSHETETVSVLELDTGGFGRETYGVGLGQLVLFCEDNMSEIPAVPSLGQVDPPEDDRENFRHELHRLGAEYGLQPDAFGSSLPKGDTSQVEWWGEVADLNLDGTASIELYSGDIKRVELKNIILLNEGDSLFPEDEFMDPIDEAMSEVSDRSWETVSEGQGGWENGGEDEDAEMEIDSETEDMLDAEAVEPIISEPETPMEIPSERTSTSTVSNVAGPSSAIAAAAAISIPERHALADEENWTRFDILESAPTEHHYYNEPRLTASTKSYTARLVKEHRALATSLPENILVRTYEDRTDLMRVLIIGPEGTPYADAPFVFDLYLNPQKFPHEPPQVYFHSHTHGLGRCNPNLYEEGKVCLSILGTWAGDRSESWNPQKSSLLQVFVSISGLVLVRSPYHCEPAFAKLEGTREGRVNSRLYSEKAYVLSRSFVRTALERTPAGFEKEIHHVYFTRGRLASVIAHGRRLIAKGEAEAALGEERDEEEDEEMWNADAMGSLSMGAILTLKRTIAALEKIQERGGGAAAEAEASGASH